MNFIYETHGDKHFGSSRGTCWKSPKNTVISAIERYLQTKHSNLDLLKKTYGDSYSVDFYIVDLMDNLNLQAEKMDVFTIQGRYTTSEFNGSTVSYHMYPDKIDNLQGFGIGISKKAAIENSH